MKFFLLTDPYRDAYTGSAGDLLRENLIVVYVARTQCQGEARGRDNGGAALVSSRIFLGPASSALALSLSQRLCAGFLLIDCA